MPKIEEVIDLSSDDEDDCIVVHPASDSEDTLEELHTVFINDTESTDKLEAEILPELKSSPLPSEKEEEDIDPLSNLDPLYVDNIDKRTNQCKSSVANTEIFPNDDKIISYGKVSVQNPNLSQSYSCQIPQNKEPPRYTKLNVSVETIPPTQTIANDKIKTLAERLAAVLKNTNVTSKPANKKLGNAEATHPVKSASFENSSSSEMSNLESTIMEVSKTTFTSTHILHRREQNNKRRKNPTNKKSSDIVYETLSPSSLNVGSSSQPTLTSPPKTLSTVKKKPGRKIGWRKNQKTSCSSVQSLPILTSQLETKITVHNSNTSFTVKERRGRKKGWRKNQGQSCSTAETLPILTSPPKKPIVHNLKTSEKKKCGRRKGQNKNKESSCSSLLDKQIKSSKNVSEVSCSDLSSEKNKRGKKNEWWKCDAQPLKDDYANNEMNKLPPINNNTSLSGNDASDDNFNCSNSPGNVEDLNKKLDFLYNKNKGALSVSVVSPIHLKRYDPVRKTAVINPTTVRCSSTDSLSTFNQSHLNEPNNNDASKRINCDINVRSNTVGIVPRQEIIVEPAKPINNVIHTSLLSLENLNETKVTIGDKVGDTVENYSLQDESNSESLKTSNEYKNDSTAVIANNTHQEQISDIRPTRVPSDGPTCIKEAPTQNQTDNLIHHDSSYVVRLRDGFVQSYKTLFDELSECKCMKMGDLLLLAMKEFRNHNLRLSTAKKITSLELKKYEIMSATKSYEESMEKYKTSFTELFWYFLKTIFTSEVFSEQVRAMLIALFLKLFLRVTLLSPEFSDSLNEARTVMLCLLNSNLMQSDIVHQVFNTSVKDFETNCWVVLDFMQGCFDEEDKNTNKVSNECKTSNRTVAYSDSIKLCSAMVEDREHIISQESANNSDNTNINNNCDANIYYTNYEPKHEVEAINSGLQKSVFTNKFVKPNKSDEVPQSLPRVVNSVPQSVIKYLDKDLSGSRSGVSSSPSSRWTADPVNEYVRQKILGVSKEIENEVQSRINDKNKSSFCLEKKNSLVNLTPDQQPQQITNNKSDKSMINGTQEGKCTLNPNTSTNFNVGFLVNEAIDNLISLDKQTSSDLSDKNVMENPTDQCRKRVHSDFVNGPNKHFKTSVTQSNMSSSQLNTSVDSTQMLSTSSVEVVSSVSRTSIIHPPSFRSVKTSNSTTPSASQPCRDVHLKSTSYHPNYSYYQQNQDRSNNVHVYNQPNNIPQHPSSRVVTNANESKKPHNSQQTQPYGVNMNSYQFHQYQASTGHQGNKSHYSNQAQPNNCFQDVRQQPCHPQKYQLHQTQPMSSQNMGQHYTQNSPAPISQHWQNPRSHQNFQTTSCSYPTQFQRNKTVRSMNPYYQQTSQASWPYYSHQVNKYQQSSQKNPSGPVTNYSYQSRTKQTPVNNLPENSRQEASVSKEGSADGNKIILSFDSSVNSILMQQLQIPHIGQDVIPPNKSVYDILNKASPTINNSYSTPHVSLSAAEQQKRKHVECGGLVQERRIEPCSSNSGLESSSNQAPVASPPKLMPDGSIRTQLDQQLPQD